MTSAVADESIVSSYVSGNILCLEARICDRISIITSAARAEALSTARLTVISRTSPLYDNS